MDEDLSRINSELTAAREAYQKAKVVFQLASDLHGEISNSHGLIALRRAKMLLGSAWDRYQDALLAFAKYRGRGDV